MTDFENYVRKLPPLDKKSEKKRESDGIPVYTLNRTKHVLPPPRVLRPYVDTRLGDLDMWPAHVGAHSSGAHVYISKNNHPAVKTSTKCETTNPPKPRFLNQLETFLRKELMVLNATEVEASEVRLQAHREVFEYLIEDFHSYRPLLSAIKNEYEMMLSQQRQTIDKLLPLKQILVNVSEQCDRKIMCLRDNEKDHMNDLKKANQVLMQKIGALYNETQNLQEQVSRLQDELSLQYEKYRTECDARKLLIADMNNLRYQQEDHILSQDSMDDLNEEQQDDPITLKIALKQARLDEKKASERLNEMVANYSDVIPRRDHEIMEQKHQLLDENYTELLESYQKIQMEFNALLDLQGRMKEERDKYYLEGEELKRSATPRPDWDKCADYVDGGEERWATLTQGKSSDEIVDVLLTEVASGAMNIGGTVPFFDGRGTEDSVPAYLRHEGPVKNRYITKRDCLLVIMDIWRARVISYSEKHEEYKQTRITDFLDEYFKSRFPIPVLAVEWAYNIHDACMRYRDSNEAVAMFWGVINNEINEEVYHRQLQYISLLLTHFTLNDPDNTTQMSKADFRKHLASFFGGINDEMLTRMCDAAERELEAENSEMLLYKNLFMEDDEGATGPFLIAVKDYFKDLKSHFIKDIIAQLGDMEYAKLDLVTNEELEQAFMIVDPTLDRESLYQYGEWVFRNVEEESNLPKSEIETQLLNGDVWRIATI